MSTFDYCAALTREQARSLEVNGPNAATSSAGTRSCEWRHYLSEPIGYYSVSGRDDIGIEDIVSVDETFTVGRYRAVVGRSPISDAGKECAILLDVRPGQVLQVAYTYSGTQPMTHAKACEKARPVAAMVVENLDRGR